MGWAVFFLALLTYCTGIHGESPWTQPPSSSVSLGGSITISCSTTQSSRSIYWYQQKAGSPRFVHCDGCSRGEGIPDRFTATRSGSTGSLAITNAQAEDEADYYCGIWNTAVTQLHGINGQSTWTQPPSSSVSLGGTITISCTTTQSSYCIGWYQQKPGEAPRYVQCSGYSRGEGIPDRFTVTKSGTTGSLAITNVQPEDEADYYCGSLNSAATQLHGGELLWGTVAKTFTLPLQVKQEATYLDL
ncbi:immunoglobulin lambda-1 light chain-like [Crotalus tigris]|uniref:immunoglobulin lambda-1 light chain-like n=1 Tax=Crotalus tigris TaxID=88082 RepID=UPI00192F8390|nr:immunoglobulin lambda-1 light chain-like [Crotalus tigris]